MVIIDTTVWIDFLRGLQTPQVAWLDRELDEQRLGLTDMIFCEVLQGIRDEGQFARVRNELMRFEIYATGGVEFAVRTAQNYRRLRAAGYTVHKTIDSWIATFCIDNGFALLHHDADLDPYEKVLGLRVIHP